MPCSANERHYSKACLALMHQFLALLNFQVKQAKNNFHLMDHLHHNLISKLLERC